MFGEVGGVPLLRSQIGEWAEGEELGDGLVLEEGHQGWLSWAAEGAEHLSSAQKDPKLEDLSRGEGLRADGEAP